MISLVASFHTYHQLQDKRIKAMFQIFQFILISLGIGLLLSVPGILLGYSMKKKHVAPNYSWFTTILCIVMVFVKRIWLSDLSFYWLTLFLVAGTTIGMYRIDIYRFITSKKSRE